MQDSTTWDNLHIFKDLQDPKIESAFKDAALEISKMGELVLAFNEIKSTKIVIELIKMRHNVVVELSTCAVYFSSILSVDTKNEEAKKLQSKLSMIFSDMAKILKPIDTFMTTCKDEEVAALLEDDIVKESAFTIAHGRKNKSFVLTKEEEALITGFSTDGLSAWGKLYSSISGTMECEVDGKTMGFASAASNLRGSNAELRESSWHAIQKAWTGHEQSAAAILNAINGWRNEELKIRSKKAGRELHALDQATHSARISRRTLDTLMSATYENRTTGQRALLCMAKARGHEQANPWDLMAPAPTKSNKSTTYSFKQGMNLIIEAFNSFSMEMGEFAQMMWDKNWIDALPTGNRQAGAYCTKFSKQREPRVFMTYNGSMGDIMTLAHELGHAYHNWVMKDMHLLKTSYPMTLAETASIFAETLVRDYLYEKAASDEERFEICWEDASMAESMLCNIPARFEFEKSLVAARAKGELSPRDLKALMKKSWETWYGDSLSEFDEMFWASKLHFSIAGMSFYNYPYLFGYLFSLGIYAQKEKMGDKFVGLYKDILRDTGSMTAEDLINKHLGKNIEETSFWQDSLDMVEQAISRFEKLAIS